MMQEATQSASKTKSRRYPATRQATSGPADPGIIAETKARQAVAAAAILRQQAIQGQKWTQSKPFLLRLGKDKERGFTSLEDYIAKSQTYSDYITNKRKARGSGERSSKRYQLIGVFTRVRFAFLLIAAIIAIPVFLNSDIIKDPNNERLHVFRAAPKPAEKTATVEAAATMTVIALTPPAEVDEPYPLAAKAEADAAEKKTGGGSLFTGPVALAIITALFIWGAAKLFGKRKGQSNAKSSGGFSFLHRNRRDTPTPSAILATPDIEPDPEYEPDNVPALDGQAIGAREENAIS